MNFAEICALIRECRKVAGLLEDDINSLYFEYDQKYRYTYFKTEEAEERVEYLRSCFEEAADCADRAYSELMFAMKELGLPDWEHTVFWERVRAEKAEKEGNDK